MKKLVSTSYAFASKRFAGRGKYGMAWQPTLFEEESPQYDSAKSPAHGKIFVLDHDTNANGRIDIEDLQWSYLEGDGDFRSAEVRLLRDESDIIITNPPFSLFREFYSWIMEGRKRFLLICNKNCLGYKEIFRDIMENRAWVGCTPMSQDLLFEFPKAFEKEFQESSKEGSKDGFMQGPPVFG